MKLFAPWLGVFETLRVEQGRPQFLEEHWDCFVEAAKALGLKTPSRRRVMKLPKFQRGLVRWRWILNGDGFREFSKAEIDRTPKAMSLSVSPVRVGSANWDARFKTLSYLTHWQARQMATTDEALLLNEREEVVSGAMTNLFMVKRGKIITPPVESGCRKGVVRQWVMEQNSVQTKRFSLKDLENADEIFLTNSWIGIRPVARLGRRRLSCGAVVRKLREAYSAYLGS